MCASDLATLWVMAGFQLSSSQLYCGIFAAQRAELLYARLQQDQQLINDKYSEKGKIQNNIVQCKHGFTLQLNNQQQRTWREGENGG